MLSAGCSAAWASGFPTQICGVCSLPVIPNKECEKTGAANTEMMLKDQQPMCEAPSNLVL